MTISFNKVSHIGEHQLNNQLELNLKSYLDWCLLGIGGWTNVSGITSGTYGGNFQTLRYTKDPAYTNGQVWEAPRKDFVFETGAPHYTGYDIVQMSGVYINDIFYSTGDSTYGHYFDYPLGRVVFDNPISSSSTVKLNYSYRDVQVYLASQSDWWNEIQYNSLRVDDSHFSQADSGAWHILGNHRVQLPAIIVDVVPRRDQNPYQLGDKSQFIRQDVEFTLLSSNKWWRNNLIDFLTFQQDCSIWLYDANIIDTSGAYQLDSRGMKNNNLTYQDIINIDQYKYKLCKFVEWDVFDIGQVNLNLHVSKVRGTLEVII